jgi:asparagine synthase (glutamine-hydrolysing)
MAHRGPDDAGYLLAAIAHEKLEPCVDGDSDPALALPDIRQLGGREFDLGIGFRRLSILDPSPAGHQPMSDEHARYWIVFNGEIYNYLELRRELEAVGIRFRSGTDTEVLLQSMIHWGPVVLTRLVGMFAFAFLDVENRTLCLARDFFGIKPLYYVSSPEMLAFASEIRSLLELPRVSREPCPQHLYDYLRFGLTDHDDGTLFAAIRQVPPGHYARFSLGRPAPPELERYWAVEPEPAPALCFEEAAAHLRELFLSSVRLHLRSDVPVGAALSGGIDSSAIVMAMRHVQDRRLEIHTFSYLADDPGVDEERWSSLVAREADACRHAVRPRADELVRDLDRLVTMQGEPFASTSIYAQYRVFRLARENGVKVVLDGQGADEILGGYRSYLSARLASLLRAGRWVEAVRFLASAWKLPESEGARLLYRTGGSLLPARVRRMARRLIGEELSPVWLDARWFRDRGVDAEAPAIDGGREFLRSQLLHSVRRTSLPMLLRYEDRNAMAASVENRVPFLTPELVRFLLSLPEEFLIDGAGTSKSVFREAMRGIVPDPILDRRDKIGFATPEASWLRSLAPWVDGLLTSPAALSIPAFNLEAMREEWQAVREGRVRFDFRVWRWVNAIRWVDLVDASFGA